MGTLIVVEGPDNSGKSTLALRIAHRFGLVVHESEGPPTETETINQRIRRYAERDRNNPLPCVYARHPVVSQPIYSAIKGNRGDVVDVNLTMDFYCVQQPILIYCDPLERGLGDHKIKDHDTPEFIADLTDKHIAVRDEYRKWASVHAKIVWRIGDDEEQLMQLVSIALRHAARKGSSTRTRTS
jgi:hypothetical protein